MLNKRGSQDSEPNVDLVKHAVRRNYVAIPAPAGLEEDTTANRPKIYAAKR